MKNISIMKYINSYSAKAYMTSFQKNEIYYSNKIKKAFFFTGLSKSFSITKSIRQFRTKSSNTNNTNLSLVVWGTNLTSTVGSGQFTKQVSGMIKFPAYQKSVIVGLIISDAWLRLASKRSKNALLGFAQSGDHSKYFYFVFLSLAHYCSSFPLVRIRNRFGKTTIGLQLETRSLPCFTELYYLFYINGVKVIPFNIYELLTPVALIMGDGSTQRHGLIICTDSYTIPEIVRLMNVLIIRYRLECTLRFHTSTQPRIYIKQHSIAQLQTIVGPYMISSLLYKIGTK